MKKMKKMIAMLCLVSVGASAFAFTGCKEEETGKIMNVALNPEVEFVLDANDKVVSVNAINEEGNLVISSEAFKNVKGKSAEEAATLFVQVSEETGFLFEGNVAAGENELKISFSGDAAEAKKLYNSVKAEVDEFVSQLDSAITVGITQAEAITKAQLEALVAECAPYIEEAKIKKMKYAQLLDEIAKSRAETAEYYSQELKNAYYDAKAHAFQEAELTVLKEKAGFMAEAAITVVENVYNVSIKALDDARAQLLDENGVYQKGLADFREKKVEFLNYKNYINSLPEAEVTPEKKARLEAIEKMLDEIETRLAGVTDGVAALRASVTESYNNILSKIKALSVKVSDHLDSVSKKQKEALTSLTTEFETKYATNKASAEAAWGEMRAKLEAGYQAE